MKNIEFSDVILTDGFWKEKQELNRRVSMRSVWKRFYDTGRIGAFRCDWKPGMDNEPHYYWDSDVAKWIEAGAYILKVSEDAELEDCIDRIVDLIAENQWEDGYFNIYFTVSGEPRFTERNDHELYCAGHLIEAAVAYYEATGKTKFLECMRAYADLIYKIFAEEESAAFATPGHEEIELALVRLYRCTGVKKYLELAGYFLKKRGNNSKDWWCADSATEYYCQDHTSVYKMDSAEGHAVRALYLYCGMMDYACEAGDTEMAGVCRRLIEDIIKHKMYITGGVGSTYMGEAFTVPYDLPNAAAYSETCASIALMMFAQRMLEADGKAEYADVIERAMYNCMLDGVSLDGRSFFYENPLAVDIRSHGRNRSTTMLVHIPITQRAEVFECSCCPPNINRTLASVQGLAYAEDNGAFIINQYMASELDHNGSRIKLDTDYPASGRMHIIAENVEELRVRIPSWHSGIKTDAHCSERDGYLIFEDPSEIELEFVMEPLVITANRNVRSDRGRAAVQYGPIVYCAEGVDNGDVYSLAISTDADISAEFSPELGMNVLTAEGIRVKETDKLYMRADEAESEPAEIRLIPYCAHANRGESDMLVWLTRIG